MYLSFFKFSKVISSSLRMIQATSFLSLSAAQGFLPRQQTIMVKYREVVSVPAIRKVWNSSTSSLSLQEKFSLLFAFQSARACIMSVDLAYFFASPTSQVLLLRICKAFSRIRQRDLFTCLIFLVRPEFKASLPKNATRGVSDSYDASDIVSTINSSYLTPATSSSRLSYPKKHFIMTPLNILAPALPMKYLYLFQSTFHLSSSKQNDFLQIALICGMLSLTSQKLNIFERSFLLVFHSSPSLNTSPLPRISLVPWIMSSNFRQELLDLEEKNSWVRSGLTITITALFKMFPMLTSTEGYMCFSTQRASLLVASPLAMSIRKENPIKEKGCSQTLQPNFYNMSRIRLSQVLGLQQYQLNMYSKPATRRMIVHKNIYCIQLMKIIEANSVNEQKISNFGQGKEVQVSRPHLVTNSEIVVLDAFFFVQVLTHSRGQQSMVTPLLLLIKSG